LNNKFPNKEVTIAERNSYKPNLYLGIFLIITGLFILLIQNSHFTWGYSWPLIVIAAGLLFFIGFFINKENYGLLMPGSILLIIGILFLYFTQMGWYHIEDLWPTFILAPGVGFFMMCFFGSKKNKLWIPGTILVLLAIIFYAQFCYYFRYWPVILILLGLYLIFSETKNKKITENNGFTSKEN